MGTINLEKFLGRFTVKEKRREDSNQRTIQGKIIYRQRKISILLEC